MKKYSYFFEIPLFFAFLILLNYYLFPNSPAFYDVHPNPFWIGILLFGMRYGVFAGIVSGVISSALYLAAIWFFGERYLFEDNFFYTLPGFFIIMGALIGIGVQRYLEQISVLKNKIIDTNEYTAKLVEEQKNLRTINSALEKRVVTKMTTLVTLYEGARKLESIHLDEVYDAVLDFFAKTLQLEQCSLYLKSENGWKMRCHKGWKSETEWPIEYVTGQGSLVEMAGTHKKVMSIREILGNDNKSNPLHSTSADMHLNNECLLAGPLRSGEGGEVLGVFAIQGIALLDLNSATTNLFNFLLGWASRAMARALFFEDLKSQEILDPQYNIYSYRYFETRFKQEFLRSKTYYLPLSILLVQLEGINKLSPKERTVLLTATSELIKGTCRDTDVIASSPENEVPFICLLTTTTEAKAREIKKLLAEKYQQLGLIKYARLSAGTASFTPATISLESILTLAKEDFSHGE